MRHTWTLDSEGDRDDYAFADGYHNGPMCKLCHHVFCKWCTPDHYDDDDCYGE